MNYRISEQLHQCKGMKQIPRERMMSDFFISRMLTFQTFHEPKTTCNCKRTSHECTVVHIGLGWLTVWTRILRAYCATALLSPKPH